MPSPLNTMSITEVYDCSPGFEQHGDVLNCSLHFCLHRDMLCKLSQFDDHFADMLACL